MLRLDGTPDYHIEITVDDVTNDRGSQMEFALEIIKKLQRKASITSAKTP